MLGSSTVYFNGNEVLDLKSRMAMNKFNIFISIFPYGNPIFMIAIFTIYPYFP